MGSHILTRIIVLCRNVSLWYSRAYESSGGGLPLNGRVPQKQTAVVLNVAVRWVLVFEMDNSCLEQE